MLIAEIAASAMEVITETVEAIKEKLVVLEDMDKPLNSLETVDFPFEDSFDIKLNEMDKPLNSDASVAGKRVAPVEGISDGDKSFSDYLGENSDKKNAPTSKEIGKMEKMEPQVTIEFKCPDGMDRKEFTRQIKGQERGLNSQTLAENMDNRAAFEQRKIETGNGRDLSEGKKAQEVAREKAVQSRIESNQKKGMSYSEAKAEVLEWIKTQDALHNPDQIAGGDPAKVSRMGDANVNRSIGKQWGNGRAEQMGNEIDKYAEGKSREELENTRMNVKLVVV